MTKQNEETKGPLPPYLPFKTLKGFIEKLKETTVPERIDSSLLRTYSGSMSRQLIAALKFLGLIEEGGVITPSLSILVSAYNSPSWPDTFAKVLRDAYQEVISDLRLEIATRAQLDERFRACGVDGETLQKCIAFYVAAMQSAGSKLSPFILERSRPGRPKGSGGRARTKRERQNEENEIEDNVTPPQSGTVRFTLPLPGKPPIQISVAENLTVEDWVMVDTTMKAYIDRKKKA